jgi:hypothetical protein
VIRGFPNIYPHFRQKPTTGNFRLADYTPGTPPTSTPRACVPRGAGSREASSALVHNLKVGHGTSSATRGRAFLLDIHYRAHPRVDTALEFVHPGGKARDFDGITGANDSGRCQAGSRLD